MPSDEKQLRAIENGVAAWLEDRCISGWRSLEDGARKGIADWLDRNRDEIIAAIAERVTERLDFEKDEVKG